MVSEVNICIRIHIYTRICCFLSQRTNEVKDNDNNDNICNNDKFSRVI
jgi:hypothetical protein